MTSFSNKSGTTDGSEEVGGSSSRTDASAVDGLAGRLDSHAEESPEEKARRQKLGVLLVNMGAADEEKVFGSKNSATMKAFREQKAPDLLVVHRVEDDLPTQSTRWYKPWTWFGGGAQVSPVRWAEAKHISGSQGDRVTESGSIDVSSESARKAAIEATVADRVREQREEADAQKQGRRRKRAGLPPVNMKPLTDEQVREGMTANVRADRDALLDSEKNIHEMLQGIEDTRFRYLVPAMELKCEKPVLRVIQCYEKQNSAASRRLRAEANTRRDQNELLPPALRASAEDEELIARRAVNYEVLECGDLVRQLRHCADSMAQDYSQGEGVKP